MTRSAPSQRHRYASCARFLVLLLVITLLSGCSAIRNHMYATSGSVMQGLSKEHTTPYVLQQSDVGMSWDEVKSGQTQTGLGQFGG